MMPEKIIALRKTESIQEGAFSSLFQHSLGYALLIKLNPQNDTFVRGFNCDLIEVRCIRP